MASSKWAKALEKKLRQIDMLKRQQSQGAQLKPDQLQKISREGELKTALSSGVPPGPGAAVAATDAGPGVPGGAPAKGTLSKRAAKRQKIMTKAAQGSKKSKKKGAALVQNTAGTARKAKGVWGKALGWCKRTVSTQGPMLVSMLGRHYHEEHGVTFSQAFGKSLMNFLNTYGGKAFDFSHHSGQEVTVSLAAAPVHTKLQKGTKGVNVMDSKLRQRSKGGEVPYLPHERVIVIGDGNFTFSLALAVHLSESAFGEQGGDGANGGDKRGKKRKRNAGIGLVATSYDKASQLQKKYGGKGELSQRLGEIRRLGARVMHGVDGTNLQASFSRPFDHIVFNFPHCGGKDGLDDSIEENKNMLMKFFRSASALLRPEGEIHVTLMARYPYTAWDIVGQARMGAGQNLAYCGEVPFHSSAYPGYNHVATTKADRMHGVGAEVTVTHVWKLNVG